MREQRQPSRFRGGGKPAALNQVVVCPHSETFLSLYITHSHPFHQIPISISNSWYIRPHYAPSRLTVVPHSTRGLLQSRDKFLRIFQD